MPGHKLTGPEGAGPRDTSLETAGQRAARRFPADPASVAAARRFVEATLSEWGHDEAVETARLCVSELVTNAVIHARSEAAISLAATGDRLRVEIDDTSPQLPLPKQYAVDAGTGRGLHLVEFLAQSWGAEAIPTGKRVWFEIALDAHATGSTAQAGPNGGTADEAPDPIRSGAPGHPDPATAPGGHDAVGAVAGVSDDELLDVHILGLPVALYRITTAHHDELQREFALIHASDSASVPARVVALAAELDAQFGTFTQEQRLRLSGADAAGEETVDLHYRVPANVGPAAQRFLDLLGEADDFCRRERLLTLEMPADARRFRNWFLSEFINQVAGAPPKRWNHQIEAGPGGWRRDAEAWAQALQGEETAVVVIDDHGLVRRWNHAAESLFGYAAREARGRPFDRLVGTTGPSGPSEPGPSAGPGWRTGLTRARWHDRSANSIDVVGYGVRVVDDGIPALAFLGVRAGGALGPDDQPAATTWRRLQLLAAERVARLESEEATDVLATVHLVSKTLSETETMSQLAAVVTRAAAESTGGVSASLYLASRDQVELAGGYGHDQRWLDQWSSVARADRLPVTRVLDDGQPLWIGDPGERDLHFPDPPAPVTVPALAVLPLRSEGRMIGALGVAYAEPRSFPPSDRRVLDALTDVCAHAVSRILARAAAEQTEVSLDSLLRTAPLGIAFFDRNLRFVRVNEQLARVNGIAATDHIGLHAGEISLQPERVVPLLEQVLRENHPILGMEWTGATQGVPTPRTYQLDLYPVHSGAGEAEGVGAILRDVTEERAATARLQSLQTLTAALARAMNRDGIARTVLEQGITEIGATSGSICLLAADGASLELVASVGYTPEVDSAWHTFALDAAFPASEVVRTGEAVFLPSEHERDAWFPLVRERPVIDNRASAIMPLVSERGAAFGALTIGFDGPRPFDDVDRSFLLALTAQCAIGLERVALGERVERALRSAERDRALLSTLLEQAPIGLAFFDLDGTCVQVNKTLAHFNGLPASELSGQPIEGVLPAAGRDLESDLRHVIRTGQPVVGQEFAAEFPATAGTRHWLMSWYPVRDETASMFAVGCLVVDITDRKQAERELEQLLAVEQATRAAAESASAWLDRLQSLANPAGGDQPRDPQASAELDELLAGLLVAVRDLFQGDAASLLITDEAGQALTTRAAVGLSTALDVVNIPVGAGFAGWVMARMEPVVVDDMASIDIISPTLRNSNLRSLIAAPLIAGGQAVGVMHVGSEAVARFTLEDAERLAIITDRVATALERSRLLTAERKARAAAEAGHDRLAFLSDASRIAASSLDRREILVRIADLTVPRIADWCEICVPSDALLVRAAVHMAGTSRARSRALRDTVETTVNGNDMIARAWRSATPATFDGPASELAASFAPDVRASLIDLAVTSCMVIPVLTRSGAEAVMVFGASASRGPYTADDLALGQELGGRVAAGLTNAALFEREHSVAESLTRAVLPEKLPDLPGLSVAARYRPAGPNIDVGGDWYDAFPLPDGRVGLVIGDVAGHGLPAAAGMVQLRNGLRAYAITGLGPSAVLERTAAFLAASDQVAEVVATVLFAIFDAHSGTLTWASAGHLPPLLVGTASAEFLATDPGPLLGIDRVATYPEHRAEVPAGAGVVFYTDGLIEQRDQNITAGFERLAAAARALESIEPQRVCTELIDALTGRAHRDDDCCILSVRRSP